jgi:drug/metabolite transporter (DMT)-like permease
VWWLGLLTMVVGEAANFAAYAFAPAVLVTPLGALSIIVSAVLAHHLLNERLNAFGILGCVLCIAGSLAIVLHAPAEAPIDSVAQIWRLAISPAFLLYAALAVGFSAHLAWNVAPKHGETNILVYIGICSVTGSLSVTSCKALGVALKLTARGNNQLTSAPTYVFLLVLILCLLTQMNYLNKALDLFNTAVVSPIYYVMFTAATIVAAWILFRDPVTITQAATQFAGFVTVIGGVFLLHATRELDLSLADLEALTRAAAAAAATASASAGGPEGCGESDGGGATTAAQSLAARLRARSAVRVGGEMAGSPTKGVGGGGGGGGGSGHTAIEMMGAVAGGGGGGGGAGAAGGGIGGAGGGAEDDLQPLLILRGAGAAGSAAVGNGSGAAAGAAGVAGGAGGGGGGNSPAKKNQGWMS